MEERPTWVLMCLPGKRARDKAQLNHGNHEIEPVSVKHNSDPMPSLLYNLYSTPISNHTCTRRSIAANVNKIA